MSIDNAVYEEFVEDLWMPAPGSDLEGGTKLDLAVAGLGLAGETGEAIEYIKKYCAGRHKELKQEELFDELGDGLYYLTKALSYTGRNLNDLMEHNVRKLCKRFDINPELYIS